MGDGELGNGTGVNRATGLTPNTLIRLEPALSLWGEDA